MKKIRLFHLDKFYYVIIVALLLIIFIAGTYLWIFNGGIAHDHETWGQFGSLLAALTGLLSFIGVLLTYLQAKKQGIASEERSSFFKMFDILNSSRLHFTIKTSGLYKYKWYNKWKRDISPLNEEKVDGSEAFFVVGRMCVLLFQQYLITELSKYIPKDKLHEILFERYTDPAFYSELRRDEINDAIDYIYRNPTSIMRGEYKINDYVLDILVDAVTAHCLNNKQYDILVSSLHSSADEMYSLYQNQIGIYFRNSYYILDMITTFINTNNNFAAIYRAQLSKDELIILFFNSFSSMSTARTRVYNVYFDLFNNLKLSNLGFPDDGYMKKDLLENLYLFYENNK